MKSALCGRRRNVKPRIRPPVKAAARRAEYMLKNLLREYYITFFRFIQRFLHICRDTVAHPAFLRATRAFAVRHALFQPALKLYTGSILRTTRAVGEMLEIMSSGRLYAMGLSSSVASPTEVVNTPRI